MPELFSALRPALRPVLLGVAALLTTATPPVAAQRRHPHLVSMSPGSTTACQARSLADGVWVVEGANDDFGRQWLQHHQSRPDRHRRGHGGGQHRHQPAARPATARAAERNGQRIARGRSPEPASDCSSANRAFADVPRCHAGPRAPASPARPRPTRPICTGCAATGCAAPETLAPDADLAVPTGGLGADGRRTRLRPDRAGRSHRLGSGADRPGQRRGLRRRAGVRAAGADDAACPGRALAQSLDRLRRRWGARWCPATARCRSAPSARRGHRADPALPAVDRPQLQRLGGAGLGT